MMKQNKKKAKQIAAMLLALAMIVTSMPQYALTVLAAEAKEDVAAAYEHVEAETAAKTETQLQTAQTSEQEEDADAVKETKTEAEADDTKTAETEVKTENVSETDDVAKTEEVETEVKMQQEAEEVKTEKNETDDVLKDEGDDSNSEDTVEKVTVSINIPYRELDRRGNKKEILLQSFRYALFDAEQTGDITLDQTYDTSLFEDMVRTGEEITIDVPVGKILYFQPVLQDKCDMDSVKYTDSTLGTITEKDGIYMLPKMEETHLGQTIGIRITAYRCFDVEFKAEGAKFYLSLEDIQNQNPTTKCEVSEKKNTTFYVVPEGNKVIKAVDSNSTGIVVRREKGKYSDYNASMCTIEIRNYLTFKDTTIISAVAEELNTYKATFDWSAEEADVFVYDDDENRVALSEKLSENKMDITEGDSFTLYVKPKNIEKGVYVEYIDEASKETIVPRSEYDAETGEYSVYIGDEEGISGDISVKISVVDICNITLKAVSNYISGGYYRYGTNEEESFEFPSVDAENSESMERESETKIKLPAGYELKIWGYDESEYGTITASAENTEVTRKRGEEEYYFSLTPTADTTVVLDVAPAKFKVNADAGVEFSISRYNDDAGAYVDVALSDDNSIDYYDSWDQTRLKIKKEAGKRYEVRAEVDNGDGETMTEYVEELDSISGEVEEGYALYELNIGSYKKVFIRSYDLVTLNFEQAEGSAGYWLNKFWITEEEGVKSWNYVEIEDNNPTAIADKNEAFFIGVRYGYGSQKLDYISTTDDAGGNLEFYEKYTEKENDREWQIYKIVPTADTTISIKVSELEYYTVTVKKGSGVKEYSSPAGYMTSEEEVFENQQENSTFSLKNIALENETDVLKVRYKVNDETEQTVKASVNSDDVEGYHIKVTGNITIYLDAVAAEEYTLKFDNTDGFNVKIWESGSYSGFESPKFLTDNQITLKNDKEYLFDIEPEDQYIVERVIATDASGKETLVERNSNGDETKKGYLIGTGYGNTGNITIKVNLKAAYRLKFEQPTDSAMEIYSWADQERIGYETIAVPAADGYSFYIPEYDAKFYKMSIRESDSYTLTTDYRMIKDDVGDTYRYAVYTVAPKSGVTQPSATATIVIEENNDTYTVTLVNEAPDQTKGVYLAYYSSSDGYSQSYKLTDNKANVTNSVYNTVEVNPMRGYTAKVTMTGQSGTSQLELVRNESGLLVYGIGELTEDKTITVTVERDTVSTYYTVGFTARNAVIRDPKYRFPYLYGEYWSDDNYDCSWEYMIAKGNSISFVVEPDYGYKVERVSIRGEVITPDENGIYTVKVARDETTIIVKTVTADTPDNPDDPIKKTSTVTFTCPENAVVTVDGVKPENNQLSVETGTQISFQAEVTDNEYEIKSVTADGAEIPYDAAAGTYTITINADTEIIITIALKQGGNEPKDKFTVRFDYPENGLAGLIYKYKDVEGSEFTSLNMEGSSGTLTVEAGTTILFQPVCDEGYRGVAKVNGNEVSRDVNAFSYSLTVNENTVVVIETRKNAESETNYPTQVKVQNVSFNNQMNLPVINAKQEITLTPSDADGSVLGVKVNPEDSVIKASIVSETKGGRTRYYLQLERPETSVGDKAEITIYNTKTGEAIAGGTFTVITRKPSTGDDPSNNEGLKISFADFDEEETPSYTYTGSAIVPSIYVTYNGVDLDEGTDYTVKCANNINVSTDAKPAKITITGKGSLSGKHEYTFKITPKDIGASEVKAGSVKVVKNAKATPVLAYNGAVLSKKDYDNQNANDKFTTSGKITLKGKGNFKGTREINVEVVEKTALNKISIKLDSAKNKNLAYDGTAKYPVFDVFDTQKNKITDRENSAYIVVYPENVVSAGTVKFTVIGIGDYTGSITKSYKIKPSAKAAGDMNISEPSANGYTFVSTGVTAYEPSVTLKDNTVLERGRDYTLAYSNNKKVGTAKCKISFIGNYKGVKAVTKEFKINPFQIADFAADNIIVADQPAGGKPSVPYIIDNVSDALVKSSEFKFMYYSDETASTEIAGKDIKKLQSGKIWVKIAPKKTSGGNYTGEKMVSYTVRESDTDLSKAKITFTPNKCAYTGDEITPECFVNGTSIKDNNKYSVRYLSNVNKGKATVIVSGAAESGYTGSKTATFTITAADIKK